MRARIILAFFVFSLLLLFAEPKEATLPTPGNLKIDGLPELPKALYDDVIRYSEFRSAGLLDWHPTKREILILTRFGDVPQVHQVATPGGDRRQLTFFPDRILSGSYNPANGNQFIFSKDEGGAEFYQYYLMDTTIGKPVLLTDGKSRNSGATWAHSGKWLAYTSTRRNGKDADILITDPQNPSNTKTLLETDATGWSVAAWSRDDQKILAGLYKSAVVSELYLVDVASGEKTKLGPEDPKSGYFDAEFASDGKGAYVISNEGSEFKSLTYLDFATKKATPLRPTLKWDVMLISLSKDGKRLAYLVNEDGVETLHVMDTKTRRDLTLPSIPAGTVGSIRWRDNSNELAFSLASATSPGDVYSIDLSANKVERWTFSETGGLDASQFPEPKLIRWNSFDGLAVSGFLYPAASKFTGPRPVIINIHGGPEGQSQPGYLGANNYYLNELGVVLIYPNVRGSAGYGRTFLNLDNGSKREDSVKDIGALIDWIKTQPNLDASRIMVTGGSYGGYMTLATMTHYSDKLRCGLDIVGISNFRTFLERTEAYRRDLRRAEYGDEREPKMRDFFETIAPLNNASKITKPMFIVQGYNDPRVNYKESEQMVSAVRKNNVPAWYLLADDEGHGFAKKRNKDYQFAATILFVKQHLLN